MPQLLVRKIESVVVDKLRQKAAKNGISMEEEHRRILREALLNTQNQPKMTIKEYLLSMPDIGDDSVFIRAKSKLRKNLF